MNEEEYISARLDAQIAWYDNKSQRAQSWFKRLRGIEVVAASSIPVIAGIAPEHPSNHYYNCNIRWADSRTVSADKPE